MDETYDGLKKIKASIFAYDSCFAYLSVCFPSLFFSVAGTPFVPATRASLNRQMSVSMNHHRATVGANHPLDIQPQQTNKGSFSQLIMELITDG